jgi:outer membrane protein
MLRISSREQAGRTDLILEGKLSGPWVAELAQAWCALRIRENGRSPRVDLREVQFIDEGGKELLRHLHAEGVELVGCGCYTEPILQAIRSGRDLGGATLRFLGLPLVGLAAASVLTAAVPAPAPPPMALSLRAALQEALSRNPSVQKSLLEVAKTQEDRKIAGSALLPEVDGVASFVRQKDNLDAVLGAPIPSYLQVGPWNYGLAGVEVHVPLFEMSLYQRWKASSHAVDSAQAQARTVREGIAALVVGQYLRSQQAAESVKAAQSRVELAQALEKLAEDQQKSGLGTSLDTLRARVQLQTERQRLIQAETRWRVAQFGLLKLLDRDPTTQLELTDPLSAPETPAFTFQDAYGQGLKLRPEMAALEARERTATSLQAAARNLRLPSVVLSGNYASMGLMPNQPWVNTYSFTVGLKVPLFTSGRVSASAARAQAELDQVRQERKDVASQVGLEVQVAQAEMESARNEVDVAAQAVDLAQQAMVQARHRFEAGVANNIEVINAQDELSRASDNHISALYRLNQARADLAKAMGQLEPLFAK